jgi:hypothetical protein
VSVEYDHLVQAQAAMRLAATATCERERLEWVRIALAWQHLDRGDEEQRSRSLLAELRGELIGPVPQSNHPRDAREAADRPPQSVNSAGALQIIKRRVHPPAAR